MKQRLSKEERKLEIRQVATELFLKKGFASCTMEDIANKINISKSGIYYHYKNTSHILVDILALEGNSKRIASIDDYLEKNHNKSYLEKVVDILIEKIFDYNAYKELYTMLLTNIKINPLLNETYQNMISISTKEFISLAKEYGFEVYIDLCNFEFMFILNSIYLGIYFLPEYKQNEIAIKKFFSKILTTYFKERLEREGHERKKFDTK